MCKWEDFEKELETLINRKSMENYFDMPDFVLAENIVNYMKNLSETLDSSWLPEPVIKELKELK